MQHGILGLSVPHKVSEFREFRKSCQKSDNSSKTVFATIIAHEFVASSARYKWQKINLCEGAHILRNILPCLNLALELDRVRPLFNVSNQQSLFIFLLAQINS